MTSRPADLARGSAATDHVSADPFAGPGELRALCRALDWSKTPLGAVETWSGSLRTVAAIVLAAPTPMIVLWGPQHVQIYNDAYRDVMGAKHPGGLGQMNGDCWPEVADFTFPIYDAVLRRGETFTFTDQRLVLDRDGAPSEGFFTLAYSPVPDTDGAVRGILVTVHETTAQVRARGARDSEREQLLFDSEHARTEAEVARARSDAVLASIADAFYLLDRDWRFTYVNDAAEPLLQTTRAALLGRTLWDAFPGVTGSVFEGPYREAMATGRVTSAEAFFEPLGTWFDVRTYPWEGGLMVHFRDIGARKEAEAERERLIAALEDAKRRVTFLAAASGALAESLDPDAVLRTVAGLAVGSAEAPGLADACVVTLATPEDARVGRWRHVIEGVNPEKVALELERQSRFPAHPDGSRGFPAVIRTGRSELVTPEMMAEQLDSVVKADPEHASYFERLDLYAAVTTPLIARGRILGALTLVRHGPIRRGALGQEDLALAEELARRAALALDNARLYASAQQSRADAEAAHTDAESARAIAETANRAKGEFLAVMSHELRTPLNAIGGYAELLELGIHGTVTDAQRQALSRIQQSQRHLLGLINQVLNYTRIDAGVVSYDIEGVAVGAALTAAEALVLPQAHARGLKYVLDGCAADLTVRADREKLQQVLLNLLTNAIKFTEPGGEVRVSCAERAGEVAISVGDTGIGIAPDKLASIFEPFVQVDQRHTRSHEGVGLGLAISRDLARGMGGDLTAESVPARGSVFTITVPRAVAG